MWSCLSITSGRRRSKVCSRTFGTPCPQPPGYKPSSIVERVKARQRNAKAKGKQTRTQAAELGVGVRTIYSCRPGRAQNSEELLEPRGPRRGGRVRRDKNVIVLRSNRRKSGIDGAHLRRCIWLRSIVGSRIFITNQKSGVFSGTRGRAFKSPRARHLSL